MADLSVLFPEIYRELGVPAGSVIPDKLELDKENKRMTLSVVSEEYRKGIREILESKLRSLVPGYSACVQVRCAASALCEEAVRDAVGSLKQELSLNGFLDGAKIMIGEDAIHLTLFNGGEKIIETSGAAQKLSERIRQIFGVQKKVAFSFAEVKERVQTPAPQPPAPEPVQKPKPAVKPEKAAVAAKAGLMLASEEMTVVMGKEPKLSGLTPIREVASETGVFTVWGEVFFTEIRETRTGARIVTVSITDYTSSINLKGIYKAYEKDMPLTRIAQGDTLVVRGEIGFDKYAGDYQMTPRDIVKVRRITRRDEAAEKRVELHLHTNMSAMDAVSPAKDVVRTAFAFGHRAVAITDHGVCQAFPDAYEEYSAIMKKNPGADFKIIYGVEAYYVDDTASVTEGIKDYPVSSEYVVFDLETTGLNAQLDSITEIGAVILGADGVGQRFSTFVNPGRKIPPDVVKLTGITDEMVKDAPGEEEAVRAFLEFAGDRLLAAHNAEFDTAFIRAAMMRHGLEQDLTVVDTLKLTQALYPDYKKYTLDAVSHNLGLPKFNHHRAYDDAAACALILSKCNALLSERGIRTVLELNSALGTRNYRHGRPYHMILLAKNRTGLRNLYRLITSSHVNYFYRKPRILRSELMKYREGLMIGSACEQGEVFRAIVEGMPWSKVKEIAAKYDYLEVQPLPNNYFMIRSGRVESEQDLIEFNAQILRLGEQLGKPVVATCDAHFIDEKDSIYRQIIQAGQGFDDSDVQAPLYFRTTGEMLKEFAYLPEAKAKEIVIDNPNRIADMIEEDMQPIPDGTFTPSIEGAEEELRTMAYTNFREIYGDDPPALFAERLDKELTSIIDNGFAVLYVIARRLVAKSESDGFHVGSRGSVGSCFVANLVGISEVNPLPAHYRCPKCKHIEMIEDAGSGYDVPDKICPRCGTLMKGDGHNIPFETFLGFKGDKSPDIDLNFSNIYQNRAHKYTEELFGTDNVFKAGTISALQDKTAFGYVRKFLEERGQIVSKSEENRLTLGCTGIKKSTGQHPGGMVVIPQGYEICDFTPAQRPADKSDSDFVTTHFDFNSMHDTILKLDELGHVVPTVYKYLEEYSGMSVNDTPMNDVNVFKLFTSPEPLGVKKEQINFDIGTLGIPEMGTNFSCNLLMEAQPKNFSDLLQISGLSHGTDVWAGNAQDLIRSGTCTISEVIGTRDGIMVYLIEKGLEPVMAFKIMESVRKGKVAKGKEPDWEKYKEAMKQCNVPDWYIGSCEKIKYMFPKAHAAAYVTSAIRIAWFKVYKPVEFYASWFSARGEDIDIDAALGGFATAKRHMDALAEKMKDPEKRSGKDEDVMTALQITCEMLARGCEFLPVDLKRSDAERYLIEDGKIRLPFNAIKGVGATAAQALKEAVNSAGDILSADELLTFPGVNQSLIDALDECGALGAIPKSSQITFF